MTWQNLKIFSVKPTSSSRVRERLNTKWRFYKLTNLTVFAVVLKNIRMACKDVVLTKPPLRNHTINCITSQDTTRQPYEDNLCLFCALALHFHGNQKLEEKKSDFFPLLKSRKDGFSPSWFPRFHMNDIPFVEVMLLLNILLYDINIVEGNIIGELVRWGVQKYENNVRLLRYNIHICYREQL